MARIHLDVPAPAAHPRIDVLANNAGGTFDRGTTGDGFDTTLQVNHLAPFLLTHLLTHLLTERLLESGARVIQTASIGHRTFGRIDLDDLVTWRSGEYYERNKPGRVNPQVHDADLVRGLWERTEALRMRLQQRRGSRLGATQEDTAPDEQDTEPGDAPHS